MPSFLESLTAPTKERAQAQLEARMRGVPWGPMEAMDIMGAADEGVDRAVWEPLAEGAGRLSSKTDSALLQALLQSAGAGASMAGSVFLAPSNLMPGPGDDAARAVKAAGLLGKLEAQGLPEAVLQKARAIQALHGEKALGDVVNEYATRGVPLFSHDLPMDEASRMARAEEMGFRGVDETLNWPLLHGTENDVEKLVSSGFIPAQGPDETTKRIFLTDDLFTAEDYAPAGEMIKTEWGMKHPTQKGGIVEVFHSNRAMPEMDFGGQRWPIGREKFIAENNAVILKNAADAKYYPDMVGNTHVLSDPSSIRLKSAAFDPRMKDSALLNALRAYGAPLGAAGLAASQLQSPPLEEQ